MLENYWYIACQSKELNTKPLSCQLFGMQLVLFRGSGGDVHALEDRCRHRNAPLSKGKVCDSTIQCPYHGWRYNADGSIAEIPSISNTSNIDLVAGVKSYHCLEQQDYIWVCIGDSPEKELPLSFPHLNEPNWVSFHMKTHFNAPVDACLENFLDCPHAVHVHHGWFRTFAKQPVQTILRTLSDGAEVEYIEEPRKKSVVWGFLSPSRSQMKHTDRFIAPATSRVDYKFSNGMHYIITSSCTPLDEGVTEVFTVVTYKAKWLAHLIRLYFKPLSKKIINQDVDILNLQSSNIAKFGGAEFTVLDTDLLYKPIKEWRKSLRDGMPPPEAGKEKNIEICL